MQKSYTNWKMFFAFVICAVLAACGHDGGTPQQVQYAQQPAPVVVQQAPAQQPVVVQQSDNTGSVIAAGLAGAALGAMAANSGGSRGYDDRYQSGPPQQANVRQVTNVTQVNKTIIVNNHGKPGDSSTNATPAAPSPAPASPAAPANKATSFAMAGSVPNPIPTVKSMPAALPVAQPKLIGSSSTTPSAALLPMPLNSPPNMARMVTNALPAPKPAPVNLTKYNMPAPKPAPVKTSYASNYKPASVSYNSGSSKKK